MPHQQLVRQSAIVLTVNAMKGGRQYLCLNEKVSLLRHRQFYLTDIAIQCCQLGGFPSQLGCFFRWVAGNILLLRVAVFLQVLSKFMRFFGLFLLNNFSITECSFCRFCWDSENCFDFKQCDAGFVVRLCSLAVRTIIPSLEITWSFVCDRMGDSVDRILTGQGGGLLWSHHTRVGSSQEV